MSMTENMKSVYVRNAELSRLTLILEKYKKTDSQVGVSIPGFQEPGTRSPQQLSTKR
jgi:hypothetical protein